MSKIKEKKGIHSGLKNLIFTDNREYNYSRYFFEEYGGGDYQFNRIWPESYEKTHQMAKES